jgi:transglutaminase-like putative cysteine protease
MFNRKSIYFIVFTLVVLPLLAGASVVKERKGEVLLKVTINAPQDTTDTRLWIPYPVSDTEQSIEDVRIDGNFTASGVYGEKVTGNLALYAEWTEPVKERFITLAFKATAIERVKKDFTKAGESSEIPVEMLPYLSSNTFIPIDGKVKEIALKATRGKKTIREKARAVYDWVVENTKRDPDVVGCGTGDVERAIKKKSGKCADISSVFVALARASGVPAREVFGLRLGKSATDDITGGHHCWAEFYLPGYGWVPVDPSDVRKIMLKKGLNSDEAKSYREYYFGAVDEYRIALGRGGRALYLNPRQKQGPLNYFMYPYAEVDGKALEWLAAQKDLKYRITFKAID